MYTKKILPEGWKKKVLAAVFLAVLGNILVQYVIPWPEFMTVSYEAAAEELAAYPLGVYLALTLLIAPLLERLNCSLTEERYLSIRRPLSAISGKSSCFTAALRFVLSFPIISFKELINSS